MRRATSIFLTGGLLLGAILVGTSAPAAAPAPRKPEIYPPPWRERMRVAFEVLVDGRPLRTIEHAGRTYLPVPQLGVEYEIRISNQGPRRITAIVSVDGLSVINGRPASEAHPGYLVDPHSSVLIQGWRRDMDRVAAFSFEERNKSYASRVGRPENIGVLGLIAIEEMSWRPVPRLDQEDSRARSAKAAPGAVGGIGTGYGRDIDSAIQYVPFVRSSNKRTITLYYDTLDALRKAGIPVDGRPHPDPFPGDSEFVPPPPANGKK